MDSDIVIREEVLALLKTNLHKAQAKMNAYADKHKIDFPFNHRLVFVKLQPYKKLSIHWGTFSN